MIISFFIILLKHFCNKLQRKLFIFWGISATDGFHTQKKDIRLKAPNKKIRKGAMWKKGLSDCFINIKLHILYCIILWWHLKKNKKILILLFLWFCSLNKNYFPSFWESSKIIFCTQIFILITYVDKNGIFCNQ